MSQKRKFSETALFRGESLACFLRFTVIFTTIIYNITT